LELLGRDITSAVNPPDGRSSTGVVASIILTGSSVATVLALKAIAATFKI